MTRVLPGYAMLRADEIWEGSHANEGGSQDSRVVLCEVNGDSVGGLTEGMVVDLEEWIGDSYRFHPTRADVIRAAIQRILDAGGER